MITTAKHIQERLLSSAMPVLLGSFMIFASAQANAQEPPQSTANAASFSEGYSLSDAAAGMRSRSANTSQFGGFHHQTQARPTIWISDIGTLLFDDLDGDGYHSGFSITIDVDSEFGDTEVYAKIYLEPSGTAAVLLHTTERFSVYGTTVGDEYRVDTELRNSFAADYYSVSIDIHDAWSDELLATANDRGFRNLKQLPLESGEMTEYAGNSGDQHNDYHYVDDNGTADVVVTEYAGLFHPAIMLILAGGLLIRRRKH